MNGTSVKGFAGSGVRSALTRVLPMAIVVGISACAAAPINKPIEGGPVDTGAGSLTRPGNSSKGVGRSSRSRCTRLGSRPSH